MSPYALLDAATDLLRAVLRFDYPADAVVSRYFRDHHRLGPRERATLAETAYAVLRKKALFDHFARSGVGLYERRMAILGFAAPRNFLQTALNRTECDWLTACDAMDVALLPSVCRHNLPDWLATRLVQQLGAVEFDALAASLLEPAPLDLRVNALQGKRDVVRDELREAGIAAQLTPYSPWGLRVAGKPAINRLEAFRRGAIEVQDEGSQLLALLTDARRGQMVADFCAGAGGKTLALGAAMRSTGRLYAFDVSARRLMALKPRLARSGLSNVYPVTIAHERDERIKRLAGKMDRVLVDAPCSGLGTLRRNPDLKWRQPESAIAELVAKQTAILSGAARLVKPGGRLVYATCSLLTDENEAIAAAFGEAHPDFAPAPIVETLQTFKVPDAPTLCSADGLYLHLWPHRHTTDGFFAAAWAHKP